MKVLFRFIKKVIFSAFLLYGYNLIAVNFNMIIPINVVTILSMCFLGMPSLLALLLFKLFVMWGGLMDLSVAKNRYYSLINSIVNNNKISHAYLIEVDNYDSDFICVLDFFHQCLKVFSLPFFHLLD